MKTLTRSLHLLVSGTALAVSGLFSVSSLTAADVFWDVSSGLWSNDSNWNPTTGPAADDSIYLQNGASGTPATTNMDTSLGANSITQSLTIGEFNIFNTVSGAINLGISGGLANAGTIFHGSGSAFELRMNRAEATGTYSNSGTITADGAGSLLYFNTRLERVLVNTGGTIEASNGGAIQFGSNSPSVYTTVRNGNLTTDGSSSILVSTLSTAFEYENVVVSNAGQFQVVIPGGGGTANRATRALFSGTSSIANTGTFIIENDTVSEAGSTTTRSAVGELSETASFNNQGTVRIENNTSVDSITDASFVISSANATFTQQGTLEVTNNSVQTNAIAEFRTANNFTNEGNVVVTGNSNNENAFFVVENSSTYFQTAGSTLLNDGGELQAAAISISGGSIGGNGGVFKGNVTVGSGATIAPGNSIGETTIDGDFLLEGIYVAELEGTSNADLLSVNGALDITSGILQLEELSGGSALQAGTFVIASYGSLVGTQFSSIVNNTGLDYSIDYDAGVGGNEIHLTMVPEPSSVALLFGGIAALWVFGRRRNS